VRDRQTIGGREDQLVLAVGREVSQVRRQSIAYDIGQRDHASRRRRLQRTIRAVAEQELPGDSHGRVLAQKPHVGHLESEEFAQPQAETALSNNGCLVPSRSRGGESLHLGSSQRHVDAAGRGRQFDPPGERRFFDQLVGQCGGEDRPQPAIQFAGRRDGEILTAFGDPMLDLSLADLTDRTGSEAVVRFPQNDARFENHMVVGRFIKSKISSM
jgi:hypothetical protein